MNKIFFIIIYLLIITTISYSQVDGSIHFSDNTFSASEVVSYFPGTSEIYVEVYDPDKNLSTTAKDTLHITLFSSIEAYGENFTLLESGNNTDLFRSAIPVETNSPPSLDGILQANRPDTLVCRYIDELNGFGNPDSVFDNTYLWVMQGILNGYSSVSTMTLTRNNNPYFIMGELYLYLFFTMNVEPGVIIKFFPHASISCYFGIFNTVGSSTEPVLLTSTNNIPSPGDWIGLSSAGANGEIYINHTIIEHATIGINTGMNLTSAIRNSIIRQCSVAGISTNSTTAGGKCNLDIENSIIEDNDVGIALMRTDPLENQDNINITNSIFSQNRIGIFLNAVGIVNVFQSLITENYEEGISFDNETTTSLLTQIKFNNCYIANNGQYDVRNLHNISQNFRFNFWGDSTTNEINLGGNPKNLARIYDYYEDPTKGLVNYSSWKNTLPEIFPIVTQISPSNGSLVMQPNVTLIWNHTDYHQLYKIEVSDDSLFNNIVFTDSLATDSAITIVNLEFDLNYFWRVKTKNLFSEGNWSDIRSFKLQNTESRWHKVNVDFNNSFYNIKFLNYNIGFAAGDSTLIIKTIDGGTNWFKVFEMSFPENQFKIFSSSFISNKVFFVGEYFTFLTEDNGLTWAVSWWEWANKIFKSIFFKPNSTFGLIVGNSGVLHKTTNLGNDWSTHTITNENLNSVNITEDGSSYIASSEGTILKSSDEGINWTNVYNYPNTGLNSIYFVNNNLGYVAGNNGVVLKTTDAGLSWQLLSSGTINNLHTFMFLNDTVGYAAGDFTILKTTDGGINWLNEISGSQYMIRSITSIDDNWVYASGLNGIILRSIIDSTVGVNDKNRFVPTTFQLMQNYPNPFNPTTKINWQAPVSSWQTLKVYDILGNEVSTLVDEFKTAGIYEADFNASNLPSGIYFYQLKTENFLETKKMILLK